MFIHSMIGKCTPYVTATHVLSFASKLSLLGREFNINTISPAFSMLGICRKFLGACRFLFTLYFFKFLLQVRRKMVHLCVGGKGGCWGRVGGRVKRGGGEGNNCLVIVFLKAKNQGFVFEWSLHIYSETGMYY